MTPALVKPYPGSNGSLRHDALARGLGWASAGLGVPQLVIPGRFAEAVGVGTATRHRAVTRIVGVRELMAAAGLLARPHPTWLWARVTGDAMDLSLMARALRHHDGRGLRRSVVTTAGLGVITAVDIYAAVTRTIGRRPRHP